MIKRSVKLEIVCHDIDGNNQRLNCNNGKYFKSIIVNRPHMTHEGILAYYNQTAVNLLNQSIEFQTILPNDIQSYSLFINSYDEYISKNTSLIERVGSEELVTFSNNLFAYGDAKSDNAIHTNDIEIDYMLKLVSKYMKIFSNAYGLSNLNDIDLSKRDDIINKIKELYSNVNKIILDSDVKELKLR